MEDQFKPAITIITVVKDDMDGLRTTAASISRQKSTNFEWLIIDGLSGDGTYDFAQTLLVNTHFSVLQTEARGIYNAMNLGLKVAKGEWVWHLNAGDVLLEDDLIQEIQNVTEEDSGLSVIATSVVYLSHLGYCFSIAMPEVFAKSFSIEAHFHHQGVILNRAIALSCGSYDEKLAFASDGKLLDRMILKGKYVILPNLTVGFEMGGASSLNFRKTMDEISSYRDYSHGFGPKSSLIIKNSMRQLVLRLEKSLLLRILIVPYLVIRQIGIHTKNPDFFMVTNKISRTEPFLSQKSKKIINVEVLSASNLNVKYLDCVRHYINSWNSVSVTSGIRYVPKVLLVAEEIPSFLDDLSEYLQLINPQDLPSAFVAQASRLTEASNSAADYVMTSDIDMLPITLAFENSLLSRTGTSFDSFFILRDVLEPGQYPICYNLAAPKTWGRLLSGTYPKMESMDILRNFLNSNGGEEGYGGMHGGIGWTLDQELLWKIIENENGSIKVIKFTDLETKHRRLDGARYRGISKWVFAPLVLFGYFHDYHIHHPVSTNTKYVWVINKLRNFRLRMIRA